MLVACSNEFPGLFSAKYGGKLVGEIMARFIQLHVVFFIIWLIVKAFGKNKAKVNKEVPL